MTESQSNRVALFLLLSIITTLLLYFIVPFGRMIAYPLVLLSTLAHELGHGIAAVLVGGEFERFVMHDNGSGVATTSSSNGFQRAIILAGGLVGPSVVAALGFRFGRHQETAKKTLMFTGVVLLIVCLVFVRNLFGFFFVSATAGLCMLLAAKARPSVCQFSMLFVSTQLGLSVFSRADYLFTREAQIEGGHVMLSDVAKLSEVLFLPYWFWGIVCGGISLAVLYYGIRSSFGLTR